MRKLLLFCIALSPFVVANVAQAIPTAYYDRPTGNIYLQNDTSGSIPVVSFYSPLGRFTGTPLHLAGTTEDLSELPYEFVIFGVSPNNASPPAPMTSLHILGQVVTDQAPLGDLELNYAVSFTPGNNYLSGLFIEIPEPSALVMIGVALGIPCLVQRAAGK